jgi:hypothetical protein
MRAREQALRSGLARLESECEGLQDAVAIANTDAASVDARIEQHRRRLDSLLLARD